MPRGRKLHSGIKASRSREAWHAKQGLMPIDFMLGVLRDGNMTFKDRMWAAQTAAPYVHPKLAQVDTRIWSAIQAESAQAGLVHLDPLQLTYEQRAQWREAVQVGTQAVDDAGMATNVIEGDYTLKDDAA